MVTIREQLKGGMQPSEAFRALFEQGFARTNHDIVRLLYTEFVDLSESAMPTVMNWNRGTNPERAGMGLTDERLNEILLPLLDEIEI